ncbi:LOW QUALITY PROTEIN: ataxin-3-like [Pollicipes pollicipes]|uniref:LOW QUALITY PROTEIN: ataxin-3-like n=1 Tax=Pollicipes pollicipes TaxID=41117 RepID=UPI001885639F|nr:LOW QUALITY PROTEIN: ataxin-3-like [Pollicipes pollicipes]
MDAIFHEKQEGSLCAQHCLNALLQGSFFTAVDLATLAQQMDEAERTRMSEAGVDSEEYRNFVSAGSQNMDDSGYFSVQVISAALRVWDLDLVPFSSSDASAAQARANLVGQTAYICNYRDHWFTIRRLGRQWFNLNSLLTGPELLSDSYLSEFMAQLLQEGYSIFIVLGMLPACTADRLLQTTTVTQAVKPRLLSEQRTIETLAGDDSQLRAALEEQLQAALAASLAQDGRSAPPPPPAEDEAEEEQLQAAIRMSLEDGSTAPARPPDISEVRAQRQAFLDRVQRDRPPP